MVLEPAGGSVDARLIAVLLQLLAESHGAGGPLGLGQVVGPAGVGAGAVLAVKVDGVVQAAAVEDVSAGKGLFPCFLFVDGLAENVDAGLEARGLGPGQVALEHGIQHQGAGLVAPVADADDDEGGARLLDLLPIHLLLVAGHVDAEGHVVLPDAVGVEVVDLVVDGLQAGQALMGGGVVVVGLVPLGPPAGIGRGLPLGEQPVEQPVEEPAQAVFLIPVDVLVFQHGVELVRGQGDPAAGVGGDGGGLIAGGQRVLGRGGLGHLLEAGLRGPHLRQPVLFLYICLGQGGGRLRPGRGRLFRRRGALLRRSLGRRGFFRRRDFHSGGSLLRFGGLGGCLRLGRLPGRTGLRLGCLCHGGRSRQGLRLLRRGLLIHGPRFHQQDLGLKHGGRVSRSPRHREGQGNDCRCHALAQIAAPSRSF